MPGISQDDPPAWCTLNDCVWDGPSGLQSKKVLKHKYGPSREVHRLFVDLLDMKNATYEDITKELCDLDDVSNIAAEQILLTFTEFYFSLSELIKQEQDESISIQYIR